MKILSHETAIEKPSAVDTGLVSGLNQAFISAGTLVLFAFGTYLLNERSWFGLTIFVTLMACFPARRWMWLQASSVAFWIFTDRLGWPAIFAIADKQAVFIWMPQLVLRIAVLLPAVGICFGWIVLTRAFEKQVRHPILGFHVIYIAAVIGTSLLVPPGLVSVWLWGVLFILAKLIWFLSYALLDRKRISLSPLAQVFSFFPMWTLTSMPIPDGLATLEKSEGKTSRELVAARWSGLRMLAWVIVLSAVRNLFGHVVHGAESDVIPLRWIPGFHVPDVYVGVSSQSFLARSVLERWISLLSGALEFILNITIYHGLMVSIARMCGFQIRRAVYRPFEARSLGEFFSRIAYYYTRLVVRAFIYPILDRLWAVKNARLRVFLAVFSGVFLGGVLIHFYLALGTIGRDGLLKELRLLFVWLPYFALIGTAVALNGVFIRTSRPRLAVIPVYFAFYTFVLSYVFWLRYTWQPWDEFSRFMFSLFGFAG